MSLLPIDLDSETIQFDNGWFSRDDLARRIKAMLDSGDYNVAKPSQALEQLTATLANLRTLAIRVTPELADAVNQMAAKQGKTAAGIVRDALAVHLGQKVEAEPPSRSNSSQSRRTTDPEVPVVPAPVAMPAVPAAPSHAPVMAGPGALRAASPDRPTVLVDKAAIVTEDATPEEAASAVDLKPKKKEDEGIEKRWFGG